MDRLAQRLSGINYNTSLLIFAPQSLQPYPVLFAEAVPGETLQSHIRNGTIRLVEDSLDPFYYTLRVIETLVIHYEDDKPDNIIAQKFTNSENEEKYRLVAIGIRFY